MLGVHTKDLYDAIAAGDYPEWDLFVQIMSDDEHPELDFDPLDDTKTWPENDFPLRHVGRMVLDRAPKNFFAESEQIAFGTGVLVDGLDFSDDKMLVGRTFSYSDTQRHRVGPNYLQLPVNAPKKRVATNQRDGADDLLRRRDRREPVRQLRAVDHGRAAARRRSRRTSSRARSIEGRLTRHQIPRTNDYKQAGERYLLSEQWERDDLVTNLTGLLGQCDRPIQERMIWHLFMIEDELGQRVGEGIGISADDVRGLEPLATQTLTEEELARAANLGNNGTARRQRDRHDPLRAQRARVDHARAGAGERPVPAVGRDGHRLGSSCGYGWRALPTLSVRQHRHRGVAAVERDHAAARVGGGAAEVEALDRRARRQPVLPHLVGRDLALEDVAAGEADALLDVRRAEHLVGLQVVAEARARSARSGR